MPFMGVGPIIAVLFFLICYTPEWITYVYSLIV